MLIGCGAFLFSALSHQQLQYGASLRHELMEEETSWFIRS